MQAAADRPPYVQFEIQPVEDRTRSQQEGHYCTRDVVFAVVTPQGSKDRIPRQADEWFTQLEQQVHEGRFPHEWLQHYRAAHKAFVEDREPPANGTSIREFSVLSPAQVQSLLNFGVRSIEDLAAANEELISRLGMGGRALKMKAVAWLENARGPGAQAERIVSLAQQNEALQATVERQAEQLAQLAAQLAALTPPKV